MAKIIRCRDVGVDCDFEARGNTVDEVIQECREHAKTAHGINDIPPELVDRVKAAIREEEPATRR